MNAARKNILSLIGLGALTAAAAAAALAGCERNEMHQQARVDPLEESKFYADGRASRVPPTGTVSRTGLRLDDALYTGVVDGKPVDAFPFPITPRVLARGQERYDIYCSVCHGYLGDANGMVVQRGFTRPPSFIRNKPDEAMSVREKALQTAPVGHFYEVITNGYGAMFSYNDRIKPEDRWAIVAYIRTLQASQAYPADKLTADERAQVAAAAEQQQQQAQGQVGGEGQSNLPPTHMAPKRTVPQEDVIPQQQQSQSTTEKSH
jgi:mono/diheme cytochrome c family protein